MVYQEVSTELQNPLARERKDVIESDLESVVLTLGLFIGFVVTLGLFIGFVVTLGLFIGLMIGVTLGLFIGLFIGVTLGLFKGFVRLFAIKVLLIKLRLPLTVMCISENM